MQLARPRDLRHSPSLLRVGVGGLLLLLLGPVVATAQDVIEAAIERHGPVSPEARAELFEQLSEEAQVLEAQAKVLKTAARLIGPNVVHVKADVTARSTLHHGPGQFLEEAGAGVVVAWDENHYVLTNRHVVSGASPSKILITLADGRIIRPTKVWDDVETDVAVLAVTAPDLVPARLGDSDKLAIGDFVLAVGSPFGLSHSVTFGIVSARGRRGLELGQSGVRLQDFIQTDASINPGNSGGPLVNLRGEVVGIITAIASNSGGSEGIGFAIPANMFVKVARQLIEHGKVRRAFLGVTLDSKFGAHQAAAIGLPQPFGAKVNEVAPNSPAEKAQLKRGDVILKIDDTLIEDDTHLVNVVNLTEVGKEISLLIYRDQEQLRITVALGQRSGF